jgi:hypothetical protein
MARTVRASSPITIAGVEIPPGARRRVEVPLGRGVAGGERALPVEVVHGSDPGPRLFVCAAIHGDEINGVEIIRRLLRRPELAALRGALIAVPVVNVFGFTALSRYLPDRRDLNRAFPGSPGGSLAARLAHTFITEVVDNATHGIDLHTGAIHRSNLPHVRACLDDVETARLAHAFGAPVILNTTLQSGSLRHEGLARKVPVLVYEGGQALRFEEAPIAAGLRGVLGVMAALGMVPPAGARPPGPEPSAARSQQWVRAPAAGILHTRAPLGIAVSAGDALGTIGDPLGAAETVVRASRAGVVVGRTELPLVHAGDALFHVAGFERPAAVASAIERFREASAGPGGRDATPEALELGE